MKTTTTAEQQNKSNEPENQPKEHYFELVKHDVLIARALPPYAKALYGVLLYHFRQKKSSFPGYEALMRETGFRSKSTVSKYLKVLEKVGLIKKQNRRGFNQSNIYFKQPITDHVKKQLVRKSHWIIEEIEKEDEERRQRRYARKMLDVNRTRYETRKVLKQLSWYLLCLLCAQEHKSTRAQSFQQTRNRNRCEVHDTDAKRISTIVDIQTPSKVNMSDSIVKNDWEKEPQKQVISTFRIQEAAKGLTKIQITLPPALQKAMGAFESVSEPKLESGGELLPSEPTTHSPEAINGSEPYFKLDATTQQMETEFADEMHYKENRSHTRNLYERAQTKGLDELSFIEQMYFTRGAIREILTIGKRIFKKMAYFYRMLENRIFPTQQMQGYAWVS